MSKSLAQVVTNMQYMPTMTGLVFRSTRMKMDKLNAQQYAHNLVCDYSVFDDNSNQYDLMLQELPDFVLHKFASHILECEPEYAHEANGADNPAFIPFMLPALIKYIANITDKDLEIEFISAWREGITSYMQNRMQELLSDALSDYNSEEGLAFNA